MLQRWYCAYSLFAAADKAEEVYPSTVRRLSLVLAYSITHRVKHARHARPHVSHLVTTIPVLLGNPPHQNTTSIHHIIHAISHTSSIHSSATCNAITATHSLSQLPSLASLLYKYKHFPFAS